MRIPALVTVTAAALTLAACADGAPVPTAILPPDAPLHADGSARFVPLPQLTYSAAEAGTGATFTFSLQGLDGRLHYPDPPFDPIPSFGPQPTWFQFRLEPNQGVVPDWVEGAGMIQSVPPKLLGQGTIRLPVTGWKTSDGQTTQVTGTLMIALEQDVIQPKQGSPYFQACGESCRRFALRATFQSSEGPLPEYLMGELTAQVSLQTEPI